MLLIASLVLGFVLGKTLGNRRSSTDQNPHERLEALAEIMDSIPDAAVLVDSGLGVIAASSNSVAMGLVANNKVVPKEVRLLINKAHKVNESFAQDLMLVRPGISSPGISSEEWEVRLNVSPLANGVSLAIAQDLSQQRRLDEVRRDFVANVSHELKTPAGALTLLAEAVQAAGDDFEAVKRFASRMQIEVQRLNALVSDLVELSLVQSEAAVRNFKEVSIAACVSEAVDAVHIAAEKQDIEIIVQDIDSDISVFGDEGQLVTALRNLISNAVKYSAAHTRVGVGAKVVNQRVQLFVTDQGDGISEADQSRVFERFYRVDPARSRDTGGTGLGLSIVKNICINHGGDIEVWSRPGEGSTFTLQLPIYQSNPDFGGK